VGTNPKLFRSSSFAGGNLHYHFVSVNDSIVPTKGVTFAANAGYTHNMGNSNSFETYNGALQLYLPLIPKISLAIRTGASTINGDPEFYQYPYIGGTNNLRGFPRERFRAKTTFYNSNELRFISKVNGYVYKGKAGIFAFYDQGRVWMPSETSSTLHHGYGAGILLAPFNIINVDVTYGHSIEGNFFQVRLEKLF
jgi:hemolysin activation/secretion protein